MVQAAEERRNGWFWVVLLEAYMDLFSIEATGRLECATCGPVLLSHATTSQCFDSPDWHASLL